MIGVRTHPNPNLSLRRKAPSIAFVRNAPEVIINAAKLGPIAHRLQAQILDHSLSLVWPNNKYSDPTTSARDLPVVIRTRSKPVRSQRMTDARKGRIQIFVGVSDNRNRCDIF